MKIRQKSYILFQSIENQNLDLWVWLKAYITIVFVRIMLEGVVSYPGHLIGFSSNPYYSLLRLISYEIYFIAITLPVILILYFLTKENIIRISKTVIVFTVVSWILPLLDFILSKGEGCKMKYPRSFSQVSYALVNFFNPFCDFSDWASIGLRIELFLVVFAIGIYAYIKTQKLKKMFIGFFTGYLWMFFLGMPLYAAYLIDLLNLPKVKKGTIYSEAFVSSGFVEDVIAKISITWLLVIVFSLPVLLFIYNRKHLFSLIKNIRPTRSIHYLILLLSGVFIGYHQLGHLWKNPFGYPFDYFAVLGLMFSVFFAFQYAVVSNDISDQLIDKISNFKRPLITQEIHEKDYRTYGALYLILSLLFAFVVSHWAFLIICLILSLCWLYSNPPLRLKKYFPVSTLTIAFINLLVVLMGYSLISGSKHFYRFPPAMALTILISFFLAINIKDIKDLLGDKKDGVYTIPTILGEAAGKKTIAGMTVLAFIIPAFILHIKALIPFSIIFSFIAFVLITILKWKEEFFFMNYYVFFLIMMNLFLESLAKS